MVKITKQYTNRESQSLDKYLGPINAILLDHVHGTMWGGSSNFGEDHGIAW